MNIVGLTPKYVIDALTITDPDNHVTVIDQISDDNFINSIMIGIVAGIVASVALAIFSSSAFFTFVFICPVLLGAAVVVGIVTRALQKQFVEKPYEDMKNEITRIYSAEDERDSLLLEDDIITLMQKCNTQARKKFIEQMNFIQLAVVENTLGEKTFKELIQECNSVHHLNWKYILEFDDLQGEDKLEAIRTNAVFHDALKASHEMVVVMRERISNQKDPHKVEFLQAINKILGVDISNEDTEMISFMLPDGSRLNYFKNWLVAKSKTISDCFKDALEGNIDLSTEHLNLLQCFEILTGNQTLPNDQEIIDALTVTANYYRMDELLEMIATKMINRFKESQVSKIDFILWVLKYVPNEPVFAALKKRTLYLSKFSEVDSLELFKQVWPYLKGWHEMREMCISYLKQLMQDPEEFKSAYSLGIEMENSEIQDICKNFLMDQDREYKLAVQGNYSFSDIPKEIYEIIKKK